MGKPHKTPYEIIFDQNQHLAHELENSRQKCSFKDSQLRELDEENFSLRNYINGLEINLRNFQKSYDELIEEIQMLKNENIELKSSTKETKDMSHIDSKALELFNQL